MSTDQADAPSREASTSVALANDTLARAAVVVGRVVVAFLWIQNVIWKEPPEFTSLARFTELAVEHPVFPPYSAVVENIILPNISVFGWFVILAEASIGAFLLVGLFTRFWGIVAVLQTVAIFLSVGMTPEEWPWAYYMMAVASLLLAAAGAGRVWGLDALFRPILIAKDSRVSGWLARAT